MFTTLEQKKSKTYSKNSLNNHLISGAPYGSLLEKKTMEDIISSFPLVAVFVFLLHTQKDSKP